MTWYIHQRNRARESAPSRKATLRQTMALEVDDRPLQENFLRTAKPSQDGQSTRFFRD